MQSIPVDGTRLGTMTCIVAPEVRIANRETGEVRKNQDGQTMYTVGIAVRRSLRSASRASRPVWSRVSRCASPD